MPAFRKVLEGVLKLKGLYFEIQEGTHYRYMTRTDRFEVVGSDEAMDDLSPS